MIDEEIRSRIVRISANICKRGCAKLVYRRGLELAVFVEALMWRTVWMIFWLKAMIARHKPDMVWIAERKMTMNL